MFKQDQTNDTHLSRLSTYERFDCAGIIHAVSQLQWLHHLGHFKNSHDWPYLHLLYIKKVTVTWRES